MTLDPETLARLKAQAHAQPRRTEAQNAVVAGILRDYQTQLIRQADASKGRQ